MRTVYALQHRSSKRWVGLTPSRFILATTANERDAVTWDFMTAAELERQSLAEFADCFAVVPVSIPADHAARS